MIVFTDSHGAAAVLVSVNTFFKISTRISPPEFLAYELHCLLHDPDFTVEYIAISLDFIQDVCCIMDSMCNVQV